MKQVFFYLWLVVIFLYTGLSCAPPAEATGTGQGSSLFINLSGFPPLGQPAGTVSSYIVTGMGANGAFFQAETTGTSTMIENLVPGDWVVTAEAKDKDGILLGRGSSRTSVDSRQNNSVEVTLCHVSGYGTLEITVLWDAEDAAEPSVGALLIPILGSIRHVCLEVTDPGRAFVRETYIPEGCYLLLLWLADKGRFVNGAIDVLWVSTGSVTARTFDFRKAGGETGNIEINIVPQMDDPLLLGMSGQLAQLREGEKMTVSAHLAEPDGNAVFVWYINGVAIGIGNEVEVGDSLAPGVYRLDLSAFSADGLRGGSMEWVFHVVR
jgi:hypothetical protein